MENKFDFTPVQGALTTAQSIFVVLPQKLNQDKVAAALSLFLSLQKAGKQVFVFCSRTMTVEYSSLVGVDRIANKIKGKNLVISFDYLEDSIEKVSYNIENNKFNLVVQPKEGFPPLSTEKVKYTYSGSQADLIFVIGASSFKDLGEIYFENKELFKEGKTVNLNICSGNIQLGKINLVDLNAASFSEVVADLLSRLRLPVNTDIASNLLAGIETATNTFSSPRVGPKTFEAAAFCLRAGARKKQEKVQLNPMPTEISAQKSPEEAERKEEKEKPSSDWLEPKIYKGNTLV